MEKEIKLDGMKIVQDSFREKMALSPQERENVDGYNKKIKNEHAKEIRNSNKELKGSKPKRKQAEIKGIVKNAKILIATAMLGTTIYAGTIGMQHYHANQNKEAILQEMNTYELNKSGLSNETIMALLNEHADMKTIETMSKEELTEKVEEITGLSEQVIKERLSKTENVSAKSIELGVKEVVDSQDGPLNVITANANNTKLNLSKAEKSILLKGYELKENITDEKVEEKNIRKESVELFNSMMEYTGIEKEQER